MNPNTPPARLESCERTILRSVPQVDPEIQYRSEVVMFRKVLSVTILGLALSAPLVAVGCASENENRPYSVTGTVPAEERTERARWTDDKGHYRPELRQQGGAPLHSIP